MTIETKCNSCNTIGTSLICDYETKYTIHRIVFDACIKCGKKLTDYQEFTKNK